MRILMFTWEFPPLISGGLGMACYGMFKALLEAEVEIDLVLPTKEVVYFPLRVPEDVDLLPVVFLDPVKHLEYETYVTTLEKGFSLQEKFDYVGASGMPESYISGVELKHYSKMIERYVSHSEHIYTTTERVWEDLKVYLSGDEDIFRKVQELTFRAERYATLLEYDVIHAHDWLTYPAGMVAKKISGKPLVAHIHATEFDRAGGPGDERIHKIEFDGMTYADRVLAVSQYTASMIISRYLIDTGKIKIVHNAYDVEEDMNIKIKRIFKGPTILFLGRITLQKGPDYFLEVASKVLEEHPEARFIMAGTGDMARRLLHKSAAMKLKNRFVFAGFLNRQQVDLILKASDIYMLPSVSEPFGIAPLEAMAYGITAVISKQSGVSEVVENAYKIDFWDIEKMAEVITYLIKNPEICAYMGESGRKEVLKIKWEEAATKIKKAYLELY